jgi:EF-P beta-lysylation protein EpmB
MIAATSRSDQPTQTPEPLPRKRWQQALAEAISDPAELCRELALDPSAVAAALPAARQFPLRVPRSFVAKMRRGDPRDPLLLQVLPLAAELDVVEGYGCDPVGDLASRASHGLLHKYSGRALLIATGACAVHCRYCFRRHFPYAEESALSDGWSSALEHLAKDPTVSELILSGGDPLSLSDRRLRQLSDGLKSIPHIRRLRIHTRYPVVLPERIDDGLIEWLRSVDMQKVVVLHANHPREIDGETRDACRHLSETGATLLNQAVLLAGINDDPVTLAELSETLFDARVLPYYLHVLDRVQGAAHFDVPEATALALHTELAARLPGYLVPKLVREIAGAPAKMPVRP